LTVVTGTGTDVGKTWVAARLAGALVARGRRVAARKPAQSFAAGDHRTDAVVLGAATGEAPEVVCPRHRWYGEPMAPPMAATALGLAPPRLSELVDEVGSSWPDPPVDHGIVEGAGGVASPLADDGDSADLAAALGADAVVVVADAGLGVIGLVRLAVGRLAPAPVVVFLNRFDAGSPLHEANRSWLVARDALVVAVAVEELAELVDTRAPR
jgi:dethiobiotin synthetase